jgi:hypothetical protein
MNMSRLLIFNKKPNEIPNINTLRPITIEDPIKKILESLIKPDLL